MLLKILLHGSEDFSCNMNKEILKATFTFLKICERFKAPFLTILKKKIFLMVFTFRTYFILFQFRYLYRTYFKRHLTFNKSFVLFSLVLAFFISCNFL